MYTIEYCSKKNFNRVLKILLKSHRNTGKTKFKNKYI